jgi:SAM-dependent methyltransferase
MKFDFALPHKKNYGEILKKICAAVAEKQSLCGFFLDHELDILRICEITGKSRDSVEQCLLEELRNPGSTVNTAWLAAGPPKNATDINAFYRSNDAYLYDLVVAHGTWERSKWRTSALSTLTKLGCKSVLDYGAGIGCDSLFFARAGIQVTYYDLNEYCRRFAEKAAEIELITTTDIHTLAEGSFDAIYCTEVLEHVSDPQEELGRMSCLLKHRGYLLATESFGATGERFLTHLLSNFDHSGQLGLLGGKVGLSLREVVPIPGNKMYVFERI